MVLLLRVVVQFVPFVFEGLICCAAPRGEPGRPFNSSKLLGDVFTVSPLPCPGRVSGQAKEYLYGQPDDSQLDQSECGGLGGVPTRLARGPATRPNHDRALKHDSQQQPMLSSGLS